MDKIIVHNPCNENTRYFRNYNYFWDKLTEELKKRYFVIENRYFKDIEKRPFPVKLLKSENIINLMDCEYIIEFSDTGFFYILSCSDVISSAMVSEHNNPFLKKVLISQFNYLNILSHVREDIFKYYPWIYFQTKFCDLDYFYNLRKKENLIDKLYFRGNISDRPILNYFNKTILEGTNNIEYYFHDIIKYKIALSISGVGQFCYRDIECMGMGIPLLRFEFNSSLNPDLIPNYHYISIERPQDLPYHVGVKTDRLGNEKHAKLIEKKFLEIKDDDQFLNMISENSRKYYEKYLSYDNNIKHTLKLLEL